MQKIILKAIVLATLAVALLSCSDGIVSENPKDDKDIKIRAEYTKIQSEIFNQYCISCHSGVVPEANLDLSSGNSYNNIVNRDNLANTAKLVVPGNSDDSFLVHKMTTNVGFMPPTGKIDNYLIDTLKVWINNGALNN